jgi:hypothetical protein
MTSSLRFAGAAALCAALLLGACAKKTTDQTTTATTDTTTGTAAPASDAGAATTAPELATSATPGAAGASGTTGGEATVTTPAPASTANAATMSGSAGNGSSTGFITLPVYPGAKAASDSGLSTSSNTGSVDIKWYTTSDDSKTVVDWYKSHLPSSFQNFEISANGKTTGTFSDEHKDGSGDQSVLISVDSNANQTRIQLATKHGK